MLSPVDVAVDADDVYVLDVFPEVNRFRVLQLTHDGRELGSYDLPEGYRTADGLTGMAVEDDGAVLLELAGGAQLVELLDADGRHRLAARDAYRVHGREYSVEHSDKMFAPATVVADGVRVGVDTDHGTRAVQFVGATADRRWRCWRGGTPAVSRRRAPRDVGRARPASHVRGHLQGSPARRW